MGRHAIPGAGSSTLEPGVYEYRFIVDGMWFDDPDAEELWTNEFGQLCYLGMTFTMTVKAQMPLRAARKLFNNGILKREETQPQRCNDVKFNKERHSWVASYCRL